MVGKTLKIFQANVGRGSPATDAALQLARDSNAAVILLQEPWFNREETLTKTHPAYQTFKPQVEGRARVLTFVRRGIKAHTIEGPPGGDHLRVLLPD